MPGKLASWPGKLAGELALCSCAMAKSSTLACCDLKPPCIYCWYRMAGSFANNLFYTNARWLWTLSHKACKFSFHSAHKMLHTHSIWQEHIPGTQKNVIRAIQQASSIVDVTPHVRANIELHAHPSARASKQAQWGTWHLCIARVCV